MAHPMVLLACALPLLALLPTTSAAIVEHQFHVGNLTVTRLCERRVITAVNECFPGPTINVTEGDQLIIHVNNNSPYNITMHWHGILQMLTAWADGADYVTQCPILPGENYTYKFNVKNQEGTLWWHAHLSWLRATVYGALIIKPRAHQSYPFPEPSGEFLTILGEWWNADVIEVENQALASGGLPNNSDAYTINGLPGDLYPCSKTQTYAIDVEPENTYLFRIINAAMNNELFFMIANHSFTVVAVDASYTEPHPTEVIVIAPGQTVDALVTMNRSEAGSSFYMAARPYASAPGITFDNTTAVARLNYKGSATGTGSTKKPKLPALPAFNDTETAHEFSSRLRGLTTSLFWDGPPKKVDRKLFMTIGLGLVECDPNGPNGTCAGPFGRRLAASVNNQSFLASRRLSMLEAFVLGVSDVFTVGFPRKPPVKFNYTDTALRSNLSLLMTSKSAKVTALKFNEAVEIVLQDTTLVVEENHPMHMHGNNFHVMALGFGNYDPVRDGNKFNLENPQERNTIGVPVGGWAVIRFRAKNPGVWMFHCHLDVHLPLGLATAFSVENGTTEDTTLLQPPADLPVC